MKLTANTLLLTLALLSAEGIAADKSVRLSTTPGSGAAMTGPRFSLRGDVGQLDAQATRVNGPLAGSRFSLKGGPQAIVVTLQTPGGPYLHARANGGGILLSWDMESTGYVLEWSMAVGSLASWSEVTGVSNNQFSVTETDGPRYYRLRRRDP